MQLNYPNSLLLSYSRKDSYYLTEMVPPVRMLIRSASLMFPSLSIFLSWVKYSSACFFLIPIILYVYAIKTINNIASRYRESVILPMQGGDATGHRQQQFQLRFIAIIQQSMGNQLCVDARKEEQLLPIEKDEIAVSLQNLPKEDQSKKIFKEKVEVASFPMVNKHVQERIKKLSKVTQAVSKIWKIKNPFNVIYANTNEKWLDQAPKGYVQLYKLKENGDFQGYFEGNLQQNYEPVLNDSIFIYPNASYFIGTSSNSGTYANEVTNLNYSGGWENEQPQGYGVEKNNKGTYKGHYNLGEKEGEGRFQWNDGSIYEGTFLKGLFHGRGSIHDPANKYTYEGSFQGGEKHGEGLEQNELESYEGHFFKGKRCGKGILKTFSNNAEKTVKISYEGNFCNGLPNGQGRLIKQGNIVEGTWSDGRMIALLSNDKCI